MPEDDAGLVILIFASPVREACGRFLVKAADLRARRPRRHQTYPYADGEIPLAGVCSTTPKR